MDMFQSTAATQWVEQQHQDMLHQADLDRLTLQALPPTSRDVDVSVPSPWFATAIVLVLALLLVASVAI